MLDLKGKVILITGASSGIGRATAILLSGYGVKLIITGRDYDKLFQTYQMLLHDGHSMVIADVAIDEGLAAIVQAINNVDGVVFCAGVIDYQPVKNLSRKKIDDIFNINFDSQVLLTQKLLKTKKVKKGASLVYISSLSSKLGFAGTAVYAASKAALSSFAKVLASELVGQKIRVNAVSPGIIKTPMTMSDDLAISIEDMAVDENKYPLGHGSVDDVANYVAFLLSEHSGWITGSDLVLDGGFTLS